MVVMNLGFVSISIGKIMNKYTSKTIIISVQMKVRKNIFRKDHQNESKHLFKEYSQLLYKNIHLTVFIFLKIKQTYYLIIYIRYYVKKGNFLGKPPQASGLH